MAASTRPDSLVGETVHFYCSVTLALGDPLRGQVISTDYATEVVVTEAMIEHSTDRLGDSWFDLVDDHEAQVRRWGHLRFARGPWPKGRLRYRYGSLEWKDARKKALADARAHPDPMIRADRIEQVKAYFESEAPDLSPKADAPSRPIYWVEDDE